MTYTCANAALTCFLGVYLVFSLHLRLLYALGIHLLTYLLTYLPESNKSAVLSRRTCSMRLFSFTIDDRAFG